VTQVRIEADYGNGGRALISEGDLAPLKDHRGYRFTLGQISKDTPNRFHYDVFLNRELLDMRYLCYANKLLGIAVMLLPKGEPPTSPKQIINYQTQRITHDGHMRTVVLSEVKHGIVEIKLRQP